MNWLDRYLEFTSGHEAPEIFHRWTAISAIAAILNRKCWTWRISEQSFMRYQSYPGQIIMCLVAGAAECRKSTTIGFAQELLHSAECIEIFDGKISPERLLGKLSELEKSRGSSIITIIADELEYFLSKQKYAEPMITNILELSAAKKISEYQTQKRQLLLHNVCFTGIWGTTPTSIGESLPEASHGNGFRSRIIWVFADKPRAPDPMFADDGVDNDKRAEEYKKLHDELVAGLIVMSRLQGKFVKTPEAVEYYDRWYRIQSDENLKSGTGQGWPGRRHEHVVRVAMCLAVARTQKLVMERIDLELAVKWLAEVEAVMDKCFVEIGKHATSAEQQKKILALFNKPEVELTTRDILRRCILFFRDAKELKTCLGSMEEARIIERISFDARENGDETWILANGKLPEAKKSKLIETESVGK